MSQRPPDRVIFDRGPLNAGSAFENPVSLITAHRPEDVEPAFAAMQEAKDNGQWLAGFLSYELGYLLSPKLADLLPEDRKVPLIQFGVFEKPQPVVHSDDNADATLAPAEPHWSPEQYARAFDIVHRYIGQGDIYQVNLTFPLLSRLTGSIDALYAKLRARQPVDYGVLVSLGETVLLSRSPELFFEQTADGVLTTRPMKGTAPRGTTPSEDDALRDALHASEKNRAENLMIVDLLRNDMSRISEIGSVKVPKLFEVERYATLHQMTSTITSQVVPDTSLRDLFAALFPCGSVTGAPKVRAMQVIHETESQPRHAYCGSIGWIAPTGAMEFNVAIRTLMIDGDNNVRINVGGGVVYDSTAEDEYAEALLKSRFAEVD